jgi:hypothetical protein
MAKLDNSDMALSRSSLAKCYDAAVQFRCNRLRASSLALIRFCFVFSEAAYAPSDETEKHWLMRVTPSLGRHSTKWSKDPLFKKEHESVLTVAGLENPIIRGPVFHPQYF